VPVRFAKPELEWQGKTFYFNFDETFAEFNRRNSIKNRRPPRGKDAGPIPRSQRDPVRSATPFAARRAARGRTHVVRGPRLIRCFR